ncbi:MAG: hypothetical protein M1598_05825 [Actinobacteria bacterium]|nr:hypothetical protein [Actinomycetota bacterium]
MARTLEFGSAALRRQGTGAVGTKLAQTGYAVDDGLLEQVIQGIKGIIAERGYATEAEVEEIARRLGG